MSDASQVVVGSDVRADLADLQHEEDALYVVLMSDLPLQRAMILAESAWAAVWAEPGSLLPYESSLAPTAWGRAAVFGDRDEARWAVDRSATELARAGLVSGEIRSFEPRSAEARRRRACKMFEARAAVQARHASSRPVSAWKVADDVVEALALQAVAWCEGVGADSHRFLDVHGVGSELPIDEAGEIVTAAAHVSNQTNAAARAHYVVELTSGEFRAAVFELASGYVSLLAGNRDPNQFLLDAHFEAIRDGLVAIAPWTVTGFVKRTSEWTSVGSSTLDAWPLVQTTIDDRNLAIPDSQPAAARGAAVCPQHGPG